MVTWVNRIRGKSFPTDTFLFIPEVQFTDLTLFKPHFQHFGHGLAEPGNYQFNYPPFSALVFLPFFKTRMPIAYFLAAVITGLVAFSLVLCRYAAGKPEAALLTTAVVVTAVLNYPFLIMVDRGNIEGVLWIVLATGLTALIGRKPAIAAVMFGLAAAMKMYPATLLALFLVRRQFRYVAISAATALISTIAALAAIGPSISVAARYIASGLQDQKVHALQFIHAAIGFDHSLFSWYKQLVGLTVAPQRRNLAIAAGSRYYLAIIIVIAVVLFWRRVTKLPLLNVLLFSVVVMIFFPYISGDYTLLHLYLPWAVFLLYLLHDSWRDPNRCSDGTLILILIAFAVLFTPQSYLVYHLPKEQTIGFGGQIKAAALAVLLWASVSVPMATSVFRELPAWESTAPLAKQDELIVVLHSHRAQWPAVEYLDQPSLTSESDHISDPQLELPLMAAAPDNPLPRETRVPLSRECPDRQS
jgi:hypothetical protein